MSKVIGELECGHFVTYGVAYGNLAVSAEYCQDCESEQSVIEEYREKWHWSCSCGRRVETLSRPYVERVMLEHSIHDKLRQRPRWYSTAPKAARHMVQKTYVQKIDPTLPIPF